MKQKQVGIYSIIGVVALLVGICIGLALPDRRFDRSMVGAHRMPDGSMMMNDGSAMDMNSMMIAMNAHLANKTGDAFDEAFLRDMIAHHAGAVDMAELALQNARHEEIKDLARAIIAAQEGEIAQMRSWLLDWYGQE